MLAPAPKKVCPTCQAEYFGGEVFCPVDATRLQTPSQMHAEAAAQLDAQDPLVGTTLGGRYKVLRRIGEGGMGIVYEAEHVLIEKRVAIKVLRADLSSRQDVVDRFRQEAKSASRIGNEHIVEIYDFGETPSGLSYFVMEYLEGEDLANVLSREGRLPAERAVRIAIQCCKALGAAHAKGIIHRDMKPENIFLVRREEEPDFVKIVDFGIAKMSDLDAPGGEGRKLTKTGMIFGTPEYMSPEQAQGKPLDHRVDIYAMGVILFEMLTGRTPFTGDSFMGVLTQHLFEEVPAMSEVAPGLQVPPQLEQVVRKALAKDPGDRFQTMEEMAQALRACMGWSSEATGTRPLPLPAAPGTPDPPPEPRAVPAAPTVIESAPPSRRSAWPWIAASAGLLALGIGGWWMLQSERAGGSEAGAAASSARAPSTERSPSKRGTPPGSPSPRRSEPTSQSPRAAPAVARTDAAAAPSPASLSQEQDAGGKKMVSIRIQTVPVQGAEVRVEGRGVVCPSTPCLIDTPAGQPIVLLARRGSWRGRISVLPSRDVELQIRLRRSSPSRKPGKSPPTTKAPRGRGPRPSDLKYPDWAQNTP